MARVDVLWEDDAATPRIAPAILEDRSPSGLSLQMNCPIRLGAHVTVRWGSEQVSGTVTNCRRAKANYVTGIKCDLVEYHNSR